MRKLPFLILLLLLFSSFKVKNAPVVLPSTKFDLVSDPPQKNQISIAKIGTLKAKEVEKMLGRKLTLKEKIGLKILQFKIKKGIKVKGDGHSSKGQTAFIISLIGLCLIVVPYVGLASIVLAIIGLVMGINAKKENPKDSKAQTAIILSLVTFGIFVLAFIAALIILASWSWY
jgi:hypothetical protein